MSDPITVGPLAAADIDAHAIQAKNLSVLRVPLPEFQYMTGVQGYVRKFHDSFGAPVADQPTLIPFERGILRARLIQEELDEYIEAVAAGDLVEIADALGDLLVVVYGSGVEHGIKLDPIVARIHESNMSKLDENGQPVPHATTPGKIGKSDRYQPPTEAIRAELQRQEATA